MKDYHVVIFGASMVGKSSLTTRFVHGAFPETYDPTIEDIYTKEVVSEGSLVSLEIVDTEGIEQFRSMRELYIRNSDAFLLLYDVSSRQSLEEILPVGEQVRSIKGDSQPVILVATKSDLMASDKSAVEIAKLGAKVASKMGLVHIVTSSKDDKGVGEVFEATIRLLRNQDPVYGHTRETQSISSASIDSLLYTRSERDARLKHKPTLRGSVLRLKKSVAGLKESKSIRNIRRVVSRASFYGSNHGRPSASSPASNPTAIHQRSQAKSPQRLSEAVADDDDDNGPQDGDAAVAPVTQDSLLQLPEMLDVSGTDPSVHRRTGVCAIM